MNKCQMGTGGAGVIVLGIRNPWRLALQPCIRVPSKPTTNTSSFDLRGAFVHPVASSSTTLTAKSLMLVVTPSTYMMESSW